LIDVKLCGGKKHTFLPFVFQKFDRTTQDKLYFESYSDVTIHEEMLADKVRTNSYRLGILRNYKSIRGKVVLDVGAGTGVLSVFCVQAGAKRVYAVEASSIAEQAKKSVKLNKMEDAITVVVDVIVSEWMGYALMHESYAASVLFARDKWLKPGAVAEDRLNFWYTVKEQYDVDMTCMFDFARKRRLQLRVLRLLLRERLLLWFSVTFQGEDKPLVLSTSPFKQETHWKQSILYLDEPVDVVQDTKIMGEITLSPSEKSPRHICAHLDCTIGEQKMKSKTFKLGIQLYSLPCYEKSKLSCATYIFHFF
uniref:Protein arginine N-methyltransferase 6 n=1 Tax=Erpetoichthys calabaricus TaxID=27687 RepID=A0A8C4SNK4_ERPCA